MDVIALRTLTLTQQQVDRLKKLPLESEISNKESIIYQTDTLPRHKVEKDTLFKYLHIKDKESIAIIKIIEEFFSYDIDKYYQETTFSNEKKDYIYNMIQEILTYYKKVLN